MGLLSWLENAGNSYLDRGINGSLAGVPAGLINTQTGQGPEPDGTAPMMTAAQHHALRMNYLMHLGQGIAQGQPAAHLDDFRNDQVTSAIQGQQLRQQQQEQAAAASIFGGTPASPAPQAAPVLGGAAPPIAPPDGASATPAMAAPVLGGAQPPGAAAPVAPPSTAKPGDQYRKWAQYMAARNKAEQAKIYTDIADKMDKDPTKTHKGAAVFGSQNGQSVLIQPNEEGDPSVTPMDASLKDQAQTDLYGKEAAKNKQDAQALEFQNVGRAAANPLMNQTQWTSMYNQVSPATQAILGPVFSPAAQAAAVKMSVSPDKAAEITATANKPADEWGAFSNAYAQKILGPGKTYRDLNADQQLGAFPAFAAQKQDPELRASLEASRALANSMRQIAINQMPTQEQADGVASDLIAHRIAPDQLSALVGGMGSQGTAFKRMVVGAAKKQQPDFNFEDASAQYQLVKSPKFQTNIRLMDGLQNSLGRLQDSANILANGKITSINKVKNWGLSQTQSTALKALQTDRLLVADDTAQLLGGGGTGAVTSDAKLNNSLEVWKNSDDPAVIAAASKEVKYLIGIRRAALTKGTFLEGNSSTPTAPAGAGHVATWKDKLFGN